MKELLAIIEAYKRAQTEKRQAALATVIAVSGSAYRRPGARMLVLEDGSTIGSVSGGCLEHAVIEQSLLALQTGEFMLLNYDTSHDDDLILGSGSGCPGSVLILVEALKNDKSQNPLLILHERLASRTVEHEFVLASVIQADGFVNETVGTRFLIERPDSTTCLQGTCPPRLDQVNAGEPPALLSTEESLPLSTDESLLLSTDESLLLSTGGSLLLSTGGSLLASIARDSMEIFSSHKTIIKDYEIDQGKLEIFLELIMPAPRLLIFGAGHDAPALAELANSSGMRVSVLDHRKAYADSGRFPGAESVSHYRPEDPSSWPQISPNCYCVVMAHNFLVDKMVLANVLQSNCCYVGALGPKLRTEKILQQLRDEGFNVNDAQLNKLHAPIGLDIGAENPHQIALSIIAEIHAVSNQRQAGFLRDRQLPIHDPQVQGTKQLLCLGSAGGSPAPGKQTTDPSSATGQPVHRSAGGSPAPESFQGQQNKPGISSSPVKKEIGCQTSP